VPIAHISLLDPEGAVSEAQRARQDGCAGVYLSPDPAARGGRRLDDPAFARFFQTAADLDMPIAFHVVVRDHQLLQEWLPRTRGERGDGGVFVFTFLGLEVMCAFTQLVTSGVFERHPRLRCAVLEAGSNWITAWLDRMDHKYEVMRDFVDLKLLPSEYFQRQCLISAEPDESITAAVVEQLGADKLIWASDYPHIDASFGVVRQIREKVSRLAPDVQRKVLGENALRFYGLSA
jgi:predicted TIM-barrel fold metal-dependent hydrolase